MDLKLKDKVVLITGGASGIGRETVKTFAQEGAITVYVDKDQKKGEELREELSKQGYKYLFLYGDLTNDDFCKSCIDETINSFSRLDVLVNNAGGNDWCDIDESDPKQFREALDRNLTLHYAMTHYAWPHLKQSKGNIVFVGSKVAIVGEGKTTAYAASKGALNSMTKELATKSVNENLGIRVNCVIPAICRTEKFDEHMKKRYPNIDEALKFWKDKIPLDSRPTTAQEIANEIVFLASSRASHTTAQIRYVDGGYIDIDRNIPPGYM
ncbi:SDR family oxidoreductase [Candidatus Pacearchaeota archaeon]|nr:SDR family oxidoreductase [Candidatus Pacearchaeota archaeon]